MLKKILISAAIVTSLFSLEIDDFIDKSQCDQIIDKGIYSVCYSYKHKSALSGWTKINGKLAIKDGIKERPKFYEEEQIPKNYRAKYSDYTGYGMRWNKGHFIVSDAEADYSYDSLITTYSMVNIIPQSALVNQKTWIKAERYGRLVASKLDELTSISIAKYKNSDSFNGISIPSDLYRVYFNNEKNFQRCFHYENVLEVDVKNDDLRNHEVDCDTLKITKR